MGYRPVIFETEWVPAGMLAVGIPAYRLPRELIAREVEAGGFRRRRRAGGKTGTLGAV
jgi:hypothetical protein